MKSITKYIDLSLPIILRNESKWHRIFGIIYTQEPYSKSCTPTTTTTTTTATNWIFWSVQYNFDNINW